MSGRSTAPPLLLRAAVIGLAAVAMLAQGFLHGDVQAVPSAAAIGSDIISFTLEPLAIDVGDTVTWTNRDGVSHTTTSGQDGVFDGSGWDSDFLSLDQSFSHTFDAPGTFPYTCRVHPSMNATVTVVAAAAVLESIAVTPATPSVAVGLSRQFTATGTFDDLSIDELTATADWASSNTAVATVNATGLATALAVGTTTVSATSGAISGSTLLTVTPAELVSIAVTPASPSIPLGLAQQFTAAGTFTDAGIQDMTTITTWASSDLSVASTSATGLATSVGVGATTISATSGAISGDTVLTVTPPALVSISVAPDLPSIARGLTLQFNATETFTGETTDDLTATAEWSSSDPTVAAIDAAGLATAAGVGTTTVSATSGEVSGSTVLTVTPAEFVSFEIAPISPSIPLGLTQQFSATASRTDGSDDDRTSTATWASSNLSVATINAVGLATSVGEGITTISATSSEVTTSTTLNVIPPALVNISVTPESPTISSGQNQQFTASGTFTDGQTLDLVATSTPTWTSSSRSVATIDAEGLATSVGVGDTTISATVGGTSGETTLAVEPVVFPQTPVPIPGAPRWSWGVMSALAAALLTWRLWRVRGRRVANRV